MESIDLNVPEAEFSRLNSLYPPTAKSSNVGERAVELIKFYFRGKDSSCQFSAPGDGIDLRIELGQDLVDIEIKGTADVEIAWSKLKVSGQPSYDRLKAGLPLYRVCGVYNRDVRIYVLKFSEDFEMKAEPRWSLSRRVAA